MPAANGESSLIKHIRGCKRRPNPCPCKKKDNNKMIGCDFCEGWTHFECAGFKTPEQQEQALTMAYSCSYCLASE